MTRFIVAVAVGNAVFYHRPLYSFTLANLDFPSSGGFLTITTALFLVIVVTIVILCMLSLVSQRLVKPFCMLSALCSAVALYFIETYGVVLDKAMMGNVFNTHFAEARALFHPKLLNYLLAFGAVPCALLSRFTIKKSAWRQRAAQLLLVLILGVIWMYAASTTWLWIDKNSRKLGGLTLPWAYIIGALRIYADHWSDSREQRLLPAARFLTHEKTIVVLVIGEAARAKNFSLYGYPRVTNPLTSAAGVVALAQSRACATYTTASLLCILSPGDPDRNWSRSDEPLPSYLQRNGIDVIWRTNNWGEPPLKVQTYQRAEDIPGACQGDACRYDESLLYGLTERIRSSAQERILVVLHLHGSHGPSYSSEYPQRFEVFTPVCKSVDLQQCTHEALVNTYDNTILYTDDLLYRVIGLLQTYSQTSSVLMYISDHGESLGEYGLYLHGAPFSIAPDVQKDIPFLIWMSKEFKQQHRVSMTLLVQQTRHSQANVFHSVMGAFDMRSEIYDSSLDVFAGRTQEATQ